jgi:N6-L-threonylcarbamoyladenine synthase
MYCLAIETSCDDTSVAILEYTSNSEFLNIVNSTKVISSKVSSQIDTHALYGGVVPEIGARLHTTNFHSVLQGCINELIEIKDTDEDTFWQELEMIAVTKEPGLASALKVGLENAKAIQYFVNNKYNKSLQIQYVNHLHGHIASAFLESKDQIGFVPFPHLHLLVSGGNTQILRLKNWTDIEIIAKTLDDAVGECFDKTARMLGFRYPGGASLARIAGMVDANLNNLNKAMINTSMNTSFSGLKTQARYICQATADIGFVYEELVNDEDKKTMIETNIEDIQSPRLKFIKSMCISIQSVCIEQLIRKLNLALIGDDKVNNYNSIGLSGGVSADLLLRKKIQEMSDLEVLIPHLKYTGDNAAMIGLAGILNKNLLNT